MKVRMAHFLDNFSAVPMKHLSMIRPAVVLLATGFLRQCSGEFIVHRNVHVGQCSKPIHQNHLIPWPTVFTIR
jgi:hypothetical protein